MLLKVKFKSAVAFPLPFIFNVPGVLSEIKLIKRLIKYIETDMHVFQTMMIMSEDVKIQDKRISPIIRKIQQGIQSGIQFT